MRVKRTGVGGKERDEQCVACAMRRDVLVAI